MVSVTNHRGLDDKGFYVDKNISLGHARLSIIDLSEKARQPFWNEDRTIAVICNGEIYNYRELRENLVERGHRFFSKSDTEVIIHLYEEKGEKCLQDLNGIFSFAVYDKRNAKIFLARDRMGVKPLYYYYHNGTLIFSSEIKAILCHPIHRNIDREALIHYFRIFFTPSPFTLIEGIKKIPPAHYLIYKHRKIDIKQYWDIEDSPEINSKEEAVAGIKNLLKDSVKRQLLSSDRSVGLFLSGGIDSSSILGMASEISSGKIKTYSTGFDIEPEKFNQDMVLAKETSRYYNTDHHELIVGGKDARDNLEKVIYHMEEPVPNPIQISTFLLARFAKKDVTVVLGGDGGDEIFGGYPRYYYSKLIDRFQLIPSLMRKRLVPYALLEMFFNKKDLRDKVNTPPGVGRYLLHMGQKAKILSRVLSGNLIKDNYTEELLREKYPEDKFSDKSKYLMYLDLFTWLSDESLLRSDKTTMAFGLEERVPILDHRLVEFAFKIPTDYKIKGKTDNKWIFREAMKEYIPSHLLNKEKKGWFSPAAKWLRGDLKELAYNVLSPDYCPATREYFDFSEIKTILDDHISQKEYNLDMIWSLLTFQIWHKTFLR